MTPAVKAQRKGLELWEIFARWPFGIYLFPKWTRAELGAADLHAKQLWKKLNRGEPQDFGLLQRQHFKRTYPRHRLWGYRSSQHRP